MVTKILGVRCKLNKLSFDISECCFVTNSLKKTIVLHGCGIEATMADPEFR